MKGKFISRSFIYIATFAITLLTLPVNIFASNATLELKHGEFGDGQFTTQIYLNTQGNTVNAVTANFIYPADLLEVAGIETTTLLENIIDKDISTSGMVYFSATSEAGVTGEGDLATVTFKAKANGTAELSFTDDAAVLDAATSENILAETETATYTISQVSELPETGVEDVVTPINALLILILIVMILLFALAGFTMWGGIYFSLGKWEVRGGYGFGVGKKKEQRKLKKSKKK